MADEAQLKVRLLRSLKAKVDTAAYENRRTLNAEIVARLERTFIEDAERNRLALKAIQASPIIKIEKRLINERASLEGRIDDLVAQVASLQERVEALENR